MALCLVVYDTVLARTLCSSIRAWAVIGGASKVRWPWYHTRAAKGIGMETDPNRRILLYGNSILMERLAFRLTLLGGWEVKRHASGEVRDVDEVDFILADLCDARTAQSLSMLCALPGVILIGVDDIANTLTVLTGRTRPLNATRDVLTVLKEAL